MRDLSGCVTRITREPFKLGRKTSRKKFRQKMTEMNIWLKRIRNLARLNEWWKVLELKLSGHYRYYGMSGNFRWLQNFYHQVVRLAFKWINLRSQKKSYNWAQFRRFLQFNPMPKPKIYHSLYTRIRRGCASEEPDEGNLHVRFCEGAHSNLERGALWALLDGRERMKSPNFSASFKKTTESIRIRKDLSSNR